MIDNKREKELEVLFDEHKTLLKRVEKMIKERGLPETFVPVIREQLEQRAVGKAVNLLIRDDDQDIEFLKARRIRHFYDGLRNNGFNHKTALTIICGLDDDSSAEQMLISSMEEE